VRNLASFKTSLNSESPAFENAANYPNATMIAYVLAKFGEVGSTHPWESFVTSDPPPKIARENALNCR